MRSTLAIVSASLLAGCTTMSGLDSDSKFACKAPDGVTCTSLSGVYANVVANNNPRSPKKQDAQDDVAAPSRAQDTSRITGNPASSGEPIRSKQKVVRVWVAPWEDADGDLHDQSFIYVVTRESEWLIEHNQRRISERYRPTFVQAGAQPSQPQQAANRLGGNPQAAVTLPGNQFLPPASQQAEVNE